jgi:hypothetical protein
MRRVGLIFSAPPSYTIYIRFGGAAGNGFGLSLTPGTLPFILDSDHIGQALKEEVHVISPGGTQTIYFLDLFKG